MTSIPTELTFSETLWSNVFGALFTALFVTFGAGVLVKMVEARETQRRLVAETQRADAMKRADEHRADALLNADQQRADTLLQAERLRADLQALLDKKHDERQQRREHEFQSRSALRESYTRLLIAQRRSRQASIALASMEGDPPDADQRPAAEAHDDFIDEYHRLALDADRPMWNELRGLREVLDDMLQHAQAGEVQACLALTETARKARQNLERSFRVRLGYEPLQKRKPLGGYDKKAHAAGSVDT